MTRTSKDTRHGEASGLEPPRLAGDQTVRTNSLACSLDTEAITHEAKLDEMNEQDQCKSILEEAITMVHFRNPFEAGLPHLPFIVKKPLVCGDGTLQNPQLDHESGQQIFF